MMFLLLYIAGIAFSIANFFFLNKEHHFRVACGLHLCIIVPASYNLFQINFEC